MANFNWNRPIHNKKPKEPAFKKLPELKGSWTHIKRQPIRSFSKEEIAEWERMHPDRLKPKSPEPSDWSLTI
jgi:hypothetical protein